MGCRRSCRKGPPGQQLQLPRSLAEIRNPIHMQAARRPHAPDATETLPAVAVATCSTQTVHIIHSHMYASTTEKVHLEADANAHTISMLHGSAHHGQPCLAHWQLTAQPTDPNTLTKNIMHMGMEPTMPSTLALGNMESTLPCTPTMTSALATDNWMLCCSVRCYRC